MVRALQVAEYDTQLEERVATLATIFRPLLTLTETVLARVEEWSSPQDCTHRRVPKIAVFLLSL